MSPSRRESREILMLLWPTFGYARAVVRGLRRYVTQRRPYWRLTLYMPQPEFFATLGDLPFDGAVTMAGRLDDERDIAAAGRPIVNVSAFAAQSLLPRALPDNRSIGRLGAHALRDAGYQRLLFAGNPEHWYSRLREEGFSDALREHGVAPGSIDARRAVEQLADELKAIDRPFGIMLHRDDAAGRVLSACRLAGLRTPDDVGMLGVDNDETICESLSPPLSSIDPAGEAVGFAAAVLLEELFSGATPPDQPRLVPPAGIVHRGSISQLLIDDPEVAFAVRFIHAHACEGLLIDQILESMSVSRRTLEKRFRATRGHTLHDEIRRVQLERSRALLCDTHMTVREVAHAVGIRDDKRFARLFRQTHGKTPTQYRRSAAAS